MEIIGQCDVCRLAFNDSVEGVPYILPLNFGYEEDCGGQVQVGDWLEFRCGYMAVLDATTSAYVEIRTL